MGIIVNSKDITKLYYNGQQYIEDEPLRLKKTYKNAYASVKVNATAGAAQTTGYLVTFTISSNSFKLYRISDITTPLTSLPSYKFILNYVTDIELSGLTLVYDGNGYFHISGTYQGGNVYVTSKYASEASLSLVDENNNSFVTNTAILTSSNASSSTSAAYTSSSLSYTQQEISRYEIFTPVLPYTVSSASTETLYFTRSNTNTLTLTESLTRV